ncbi:MAG: hypothetical protein IJS54_07465 [Desulfovibrio sp.]|nr:hypothetical protein [Desulfovibrio sp.]
MNLWKCPSAREFMQDVCQTVRIHDSHVCLVMPGLGINTFVQEFTAYAENYLSEIIPIEIGKHNDPKACFLSAFQTASAIPGLEAVMDCCAQSTYLLLVVSKDVADPKGMIADLCQTIARLSKQKKDANATLLWRLIVVLPAHIPWPDETPSLKVNLWWGQIHPSDTEYAIEHCLRESIPSALHEWEYLWLYSLCQGLAVIDPMIADTIFHQLPTCLEEIETLFDNHPVRKLSPEAQKAIIRLDTLGNIPQDQPKDGDVRLLWSLGALDMRENVSAMLHPAAYVAANRISSLERLVVQGQIKVYFPIVQEVHGFLCSQLQKSCGDHWNKYDPHFQTINDEIGALPKYMSLYLKGKHDPELYELACSWRAIRNSLAHGTMIQCQTAIDAHKKYRNLVEKCKG